MSKPSSTHSTKNTDDVQILKSEGVVQTFPHARCNCLIIPFNYSNATTCYQFCPNCWCYACDIPVHSCTSWATHCFATPDLQEWNHHRQQTLLKRQHTTNVNSKTQHKPPAQVTLIPAGTPHGVHAEHLQDVGYSSTWSSSSSVSVTPHIPEPMFHRFDRGKFCSCCTTKEDVQLLDGHDSLDGIFRTIDCHDFINMKRHSAVSGRGVPRDCHTLSDYETCWQCKKCGDPPPIDVNAILNRQRKQFLVTRRQ